MTTANPDAAQRFFCEVIEPFRVRDCNGVERNYAEYLKLPATERTGDEADVVDRIFTIRALSWLGFDTEHFTYNKTDRNAKGNRPDFMAHASVGVAFIWEDKGSSEELDSRQHFNQLRRYCSGTAGYAVWCNIRRLVILRFDPNGTHSTIIDVNVEGLFGAAKLSRPEVERQLEALELVYLLLNRARFTDFPDLLNSICITEEEYLQRAMPLCDDQAQRGFISGAYQMLRNLKLSAFARIDAAINSNTDCEIITNQLLEEWDKAQHDFINRLPIQYQSRIGEALNKLSRHIGQLKSSDIEGVRDLLLQGNPLPPPVAYDLKRWSEIAARINAGYIFITLESAADSQIVSAYRIWSERQPEAELASPDIFAEQSAYVFFVRLLLARTLEDKHLLPSRIASNGGLTAWRDIINRFFGTSATSIYGSSFIDLLSERVSHFYRHFFQQPVFDWFLPDDLILVQALEFLGRYNFAEIQSDIIGFTYEQYIDRVARNKKGHFLTRPAVVDYMLDTIKYCGANIIGRTFLDPACGSGSFIVAAAARYRRALLDSVALKHHLTMEEIESPNNPHRLFLAKEYLRALEENFYGMDLDPFSCYLAELNLLVSGIADLHCLWKNGQQEAIDRFNIYNTDSLDLPYSLLRSTTGGMQVLGENLAEEIVDEAYSIKLKSGDNAQGFYYIISNPPYVTSKKQSLSQIYREQPFFLEALSGDVNTYLLFLRLGIHYIAENGLLCFIVPLTILGDQSAARIREMLNSHGIYVTALRRFYTGNVLFPGVDQATAIIIAHRTSQPPELISVSGGTTVENCRDSEQDVARESVFTHVPGTDRYPWLVSSDSRAYTVWSECNSQANGFLAALWQELDAKQGDVNATYVRQYKEGRGTPLPLYKGENFTRFSPLAAENAEIAYVPAAPSDLVGRRLQSLLMLDKVEIGVVMREVARLNTRERLLVSFFQREPGNSFAFTHSIWRISGNLQQEHSVYVLLAVLSSRLIAYLLNLFSSNNNVLQSELGTIPIPLIERLPVVQLASLCKNALELRAYIEQRFANQLNAKLPDHNGDGVPSPISVLTESRLPAIRVKDAELRGLIRLSDSRGALASRIKVDGSQSFIAATRLIIDYDKTSRWEDIQELSIPEPAVSQQYLTSYNALVTESAQQWENFQNIQTKIDELVYDWYNLSQESREAVRDGLPWARRGN